MPDSLAQLASAAAEKVWIGRSDELVERGHALRFSVAISTSSATGSATGTATAFAVRFEGVVHGYLNRCAHVPVEMDWQPGRFFDLTGLYLICATHGAMYLPDSGLCVDGPCRGRRLVKLDVFECDGSIYWRPDRLVHPLSAARIPATPPNSSS